MIYLNTALLLAILGMMLFGNRKRSDEAIERALTARLKASEEKLKAAERGQLL